MPPPPGLGRRFSDCRDARPDVQELPYPGVADEETDRAAEERPVRPDIADNRRPDSDHFLGGDPVRREVVLAAKSAVIHPRGMRHGDIKSRRKQAFAVISNRKLRHAVASQKSEVQSRSCSRPAAAPLSCLPVWVQAERAVAPIARILVRLQKPCEACLHPSPIEPLPPSRQGTVKSHMSLR